MPLQLWIAYPDDLLNDEAARGCAAILNQEEQSRWQRFKFERHRRESLASRALIRSALSHSRPIAPEAWRFVTNPHGKPAADPGGGLRFNASNSVGLVVCLIAEAAEVGVDVEPVTRAETMLNIAPEVFSDGERAQLTSLSQERQLDRALSLWTLKEAYIKARGMGLALPLKKFSFLFGGDEGITLQVDPILQDDPGHWRFFLFDHEGHRVAGAVERGAAEKLEIFEARPPLAEPIHRNDCAVEWFPRN